MDYRLEAARLVEPRGHLVGQALVLDKAIGTRRSDRVFVKTLGVELAILDASNLGTDQCSAAPEVLGAVIRPTRELFVMGEEHLRMARPVLGAGRAAVGCPRERPVEMVFGL